MTSKSILVLGIVFIFLLNVVAVHNYIDGSYYNSYPTKSNEVTPIKIKPKEKKISVIPIVKEEKKLPVEDITLYKSLQLSSTKEEYNYSQKLIRKQDEKLEKEANKKIKNSVIKPSKNMIISLELGIENSYEKENPIIKKIAKNFNKNRSIIIKIYQFNSKIKKYVKSIKDDLVSNEIDIDDIKVIYNKIDNKNKNKIDVLLIKKD